MSEENEPRLTAERAQRWAGLVQAARGRLGGRTAPDPGRITLDADDWAVSAAEVDRATWQQRATSAERRVEELRGEVVVLRRALAGALLPLEALNIAVQWELAESVKAEIADAVSKGREALNATQRSAQLGALAEAALALQQLYDRWRKRDEGDLPAVWVHLLLGLEHVTAAADAVLTQDKDALDKPS